jgi:hypothetical protein
VAEEPHRGTVIALVTQRAWKRGPQKVKRKAGRRAE